MTIGIMAQDLRTEHNRLSELRDADFRAVVQPMIATGRVDYTAGLKIKIASAGR